MGGHALSHTSVRLTASNYERVATDCVAKLKALYPDNRVEPVVAYRSKSDFGDLDLLVESKNYDPLKAAAALGAVEVVRNGPVTSVGLKVRPEVEQLEGNLFQVDLMKTSPESFDYAAGYFAYNDLGNLCGRVAKQLGLTHGHEGLLLPMREGDYLFTTLTVTTDFDSALAFLGYDPKRFREGFETLEDVFLYAASSPFFNKAVYQLEARNHTARVRDRKRKTYMEFLQWLETRNDLPAYEYPKDRKEWLPKVFEAFPAVQPEYEKALAKLEQTRQVKARFNGAMVAKLTGKQGKDLGQVMARFKASFGAQSDVSGAEAKLADFVLGATQEELENRVRQAAAACAEA
jgi:hypothetical protein